MINGNLHSISITRTINIIKFILKYHRYDKIYSKFDIMKAKNVLFQSVWYKTKILSCASKVPFITIHLVLVYLHYRV